MMGAGYRLGKMFKPVSLISPENHSILFLFYFIYYIIYAMRLLRTILAIQKLAVGA